MNSADIVKRGATGTSLGLATVFIVGSVATLSGSANVSWRALESSRINYSNTSPATYWIGERGHYRKKSFRMLRFLKRGRSKPFVNHASFFSYWG